MLCDEPTGALDYETSKETLRLLEAVRKKYVESLGIKFYNNYYVNHKSKDGSVVRIFDERTKCDLPYVKLGRLPKNSDDIFLDQIYASKKKLHLGDEITLADKKYKICGIGAFPDYAISLETATQMLADRSKFGVGMSSSFDGYIEEQKNNSLCKYQYCVSDGYEIKNDAVEEATVGNFEYTDKKLKQTYSISGIGVIKNSDFFKKINRLTSDEIIISKDTAQKFVLKKDDVIKLENSATGQVDKYKIKDVVDYNLGLCFFTQQSEMNNILLKDVNYHNYYFSNKKIDIPKKYLVSKLSVEDYVSNGQVMKNAMKSMIMMFPTVAVIIYMIIMYILIKLVISQNEIGISMLKVFGFTESEIRKMYINTNTIITILFVLISLPLQYNFMVSIWPACIKTIPGYIGFVMEGKHLLIIALTGIVCYFIANVTSLNKVKKVPMVIALKNQDI